MMLCARYVKNFGETGWEFNAPSQSDDQSWSSYPESPSGYDTVESTLDQDSQDEPWPDEEEYPSHIVHMVEAVIEEDNACENSNFCHSTMEEPLEPEYESFGPEMFYEPLEPEKLYSKHHPTTAVCLPNPRMNARQQQHGGYVDIDSVAFTVDEVESMQRLDADEMTPTLRLRGLPYNASERDVCNFLGCHRSFLRSENPIVFVPHRDGRPSGFAMVSFISQASARVAQRDLDKKIMGSRYIEVFGPLNKNSHRFVKSTAPIKGNIIRELRQMLKNGTMLMSMMGVLLSEEARQFLKTQGIGLKAFFQRCSDEFLVEGKKGEEKVHWLRAVRPHTRANTMSRHPCPMPRARFPQACN